MPYGYTKDDRNNLIVDNEEQEIYLKMVEMSLKNIGTNKIATWLNDNGIITKGQNLG